MMTARDIYDLACNIMFEESGEDRYFKRSALSLINLLISEAMPYQNSRERARGEAASEFTACSSFDSEIKLDLPIAYHALPFGLAAYFYQDEEDNFRAQDYRGRFITALCEAAHFCETDICDLYGGE